MVTNQKSPQETQGETHGRAKKKTSRHSPKPSQTYENPLHS